jgi:hypothetical protein
MFAADRHAIGPISRIKRVGPRRKRNMPDAGLWPAGRRYLPGHPVPRSLRYGPPLLLLVPPVAIAPAWQAGPNRPPFSVWRDPDE